MDILRRATTKIAQTVGLANAVPPDEKLEGYNRQLERLVEMIGVLQTNFSKYSQSLIDMSKAACIVGKDVAQFYDKSAARQKSIQLFTDALFTIDSATFDIFKNDFGWEILQAFDDWISEARKLQHNIKTAEETRQKIGNLNQKLKSLEGRSGSEMELQTTRERLAALVKRYASMNLSLDTSVVRFLESRFATFDKCFVRLMESQVEFFRTGLRQTENFVPNIENYRARFPRQKPGSDFATSVSNSSAASVPPAASGAAPRREQRNGAIPDTLAEYKVGTTGDHEKLDDSDSDEENDFSCGAPEDQKPSENVPNVQCQGKAAVMATSRALPTPPVNALSTAASASSSVSVGASGVGGASSNPSSSPLFASIPPVSRQDSLDFFSQPASAASKSGLPPTAPVKRQSSDDSKKSLQQPRTPTSFDVFAAAAASSPKIAEPPDFFAVDPVQSALGGSSDDLGIFSQAAPPSPAQKTVTASQSSTSYSGSGSFAASGGSTSSQSLNLGLNVSSASSVQSKRTTPAPTPPLAPAPYQQQQPPVQPQPRQKPQRRMPQSSIPSSSSLLGDLGFDPISSKSPVSAFDARSRSPAPSGSYPVQRPSSSSGFATVTPSPLKKGDVSVFDPLLSGASITLEAPKLSRSNSGNQVTVNAAFQTQVADPEAPVIVGGDEDARFSGNRQLGETRMEQKKAALKCSKEEEEAEEAEYQATKLPRQTKTEWLVERAQQEKANELQERSLKHELEQQLRFEAIDSTEDFIKSWQYKNGVPKNLRNLLSSLHTILWPGLDWKPITIADLTDYNSVRKYHRKAVMAVHPDKHQNDSPEHKVIAQKAFEAINVAWKQFEEQGHQ